MIEPERFGLDPLATLAHVSPGLPASGHAAFWRLWGEMVGSCVPELTEARAEDADASDPGVSHVFESVRHVRIGCRVVAPPGVARARACVVTTHGYGEVESLAEQTERWETVASRGVAVVAVRVRGYPGSTMDTGAIWSEPGGWITWGLPNGPPSPAEAMGWVYPLAVGDVVNAMRAAWRRFQAPVWLHGESLGGGLAVAAASQGGGVLGGAGDSLGETGPEAGVGVRIDPDGGGEGVAVPAVERMVIGLPSMGDWAWRWQASERSGLGVCGTLGDVRAAAMARGARAEDLIETLRLVDSGVLARRVLGAVLCKLALCDEVVPAPSACAVYNALGTAPGRKWRFVVPYGHTDAGLTNARRHALFDRILREFLDPDTEPEQVCARWRGVLDRPDEVPRGPAGGDRAGA